MVILRERVSCRGTTLRLNAISLAIVGANSILATLEFQSLTPSGMATKIILHRSVF